LQEQCALSDGKFRLGTDSEKAERFVFNSIMMISRKPIKRSPFLTDVTNELPCVLADQAGGLRSRSLVKLRSALHADEIFHRAMSLTHSGGGL